MSAPDSFLGMADRLSQCLGEPLIRRAEEIDTFARPLSPELLRPAHTPAPDADHVAARAACVMAMREMGREASAKLYASGAWDEDELMVVAVNACRLRMKGIEE